LAVRDLALTGKDLIQELGLAPGPRIGSTLRKLLQAVLDNPEKNQREALLDLAKSLQSPD
jgi:hypothetical protein